MAITLLYASAVFQAIVMLMDEFYFHHQRKLPKWEQIGHPLDTLSVIIIFFAYCFLSLAISDSWYYFLIVFSCLLITKDERVHHRVCQAAEQWLHALLFLIHPVFLVSSFVVWKQTPDLIFFKLQLGVFVLFFGYQVIYWNFIYEQNPSS